MAAYPAPVTLVRFDGDTVGADTVTDARSEPWSDPRAVTGTDSRTDSSTDTSTDTDAIVVLLLGADPRSDRFTVDTPAARTTVVAVPDPAAAGPVAAELVDAGAVRVELCGGLGPETAGRVADAVGGRAPVGAVSFGIDSVDGAALFRDRVARQAPMTAGFVYRHEGLDPVADRRVVELGPLRTEFVPVSREDDAVAVTAELAEAGAELIELYRGIGPAAATRVIEAVGGRAPVGVARYARP